MRTRRPVQDLGVVLAPGAGTGADHPALLAIDAALGDVPTLRFDFPYRLAGKRPPDRPPVLLAAYRDAVDRLVASAGVSRVVVAGRSMGGRIGSMLAAEGHRSIVGVACVAYPLHPPKHPDRLRTEHLGSIDVPCLFVSGDRDPFGTPLEFETALVAIPGPVTQVWIPDKAHDLRGVDGQVADVVAGWVGQLASG